MQIRVVVIFAFDWTFYYYYMTCNCMQPVGWHFPGDLESTIAHELHVPCAVMKSRAKVNTRLAAREQAKQGLPTLPTAMSILK